MALNKVAARRYPAYFAYIDDALETCKGATSQISSRRARRARRTAPGRSPGDPPVVTTGFSLRRARRRRQLRPGVPRHRHRHQHHRRVPEFSCRCRGVQLRALALSAASDAAAATKRRHEPGPRARDRRHRPGRRTRLWWTICARSPPRARSNSSLRATAWAARSPSPRRDGSTTNCRSWAAASPYGRTRSPRPPSGTSLSRPGSPQHSLITRR